METDVILLDTHIVVWLAAGRMDRLSVGVIDLIEKNRLAISPIVELELSYLHEIGRITAPASVIIGQLAARIGLAIDDVPYGRICNAAAGLSWTRDPFDRLQAAHAEYRQVPLVTKDADLLAHLPLAVWPE